MRASQESLCRNVLVAIALDQDQDHLVRVALRAARQWEDETAVHALTVVNGHRTGLIADRNNQRALSSALATLEDVLRRAVAGTDPASRRALLFAHARVGPTADEIVGLAVELNVDLTVVGAGSEGESHTAKHVVEWASSPVLVVQPPLSRESEFLPKFHRCKECTQVRRASRGAEWFCEGHQDPSLRRSESFGTAAVPGRAA